MLLHFICIPVKPKAPWLLWLPISGGSGECPPPFLGSHSNWWQPGCSGLMGCRGGLSFSQPHWHICQSHQQRPNLPSPKGNLPVLCSGKKWKVHVIWFLLPGLQIMVGKTPHLYPRDFMGGKKHESSSLPTWPKRGEHSDSWRARSRIFPAQELQAGRKIKSLFGIHYEP